jgi:hypothetical protein
VAAVAALTMMGSDVIHAFWAFRGRTTVKRYPLEGFFKAGQVVLEHRVSTATDPV